MKFFPLRLGGIERRCGRADIHKSEPPRVAVGQNPHPVADQRSSVPANRLAMLHVIAGESLRRSQRQRLSFRYGLA